MRISKIYTKNLNDKVLEYLKLKEIFCFIENEIKYINDDVINMFTKMVIQMNKENSNNFEQLFNNILNKLKEKNNGLYDCVLQSVKENENQFLCNLDILVDYAKVLGKSDCEGQLKALIFYREKIDFEIDKSRLEQNKNEKMYKSLGVICGLMLVIVLI